MFALVKLIFMLILTIIGRLIEHARHIDPKGLELKTVYHVFNINLPISLGAIGWVWATSKTEYIFYLFLPLLVGCVFRGLFSNHNPDTLNIFRDRDSRNGIWIPTICASTNYFFCIALQLCETFKK